MIDASADQISLICQIIEHYVPICELRVFGSRVSGKAKPWSDLDIVIMGDAKLNTLTLGSIREALDESDLPFRVDIQDWHGISKEFQAVIEQRYEAIMIGVGR